jgi:hypothetical protein
LDGAKLKSVIVDVTPSSRSRLSTQRLGLSRSRGQRLAVDERLL